MNFALNGYALTLLVSGVLALGISIYMGVKLKDSLRWLAYTTISFSVWGFFYGVELASRTVHDMLVWSKFQYLGLVLAPAFWVIFSLKYTDYQSRNYGRIIAGIMALPIITYLIVLTNGWHHLHYKSNWLVTSGPFPILGIEKGPWYYVQIAYCYLYYFLGTALLWTRFRHANRHFKNQTRILILGGLFPLIINVLYQISWVKPFEGLDLTPYAFLFTYLLIAVAVLNYNLLSIKPIARDKLLEVMTRGIFVFDGENKLVDFNSSAANFLPHGTQLRLGSTAHGIFQGRDDILRLIALRSKTIIESKIENHGVSQILKIESVPLANKQSASSGLLLLMNDITKDVEINEQLRKQALELQQLNELKDKLFSIISHDLRGPILGVNELIQLAYSGQISHEELMGILPEASKNMEQVTQLLENLLAWTSAQLRGEEYKLQTTELAQVVDGQVSLLNKSAKEKRLKIKLNGFEDARVLADKDMIELILRNLLANAIKFSNPGTEIQVICKHQSDSVLIHVKDQGIGISEENLNRLNAGVSFSTRGQNNELGTGIGLMMVREYLSKIGGKLEIKSSPGQGSEFIITLPSDKS